MKIKWEVQSVPTGRYRSFSRRGWPTAYFTVKSAHGFEALVTAFYAQHPEWLPPAPVTTPPEEGNQQNVTKVPLT